MINILLFISIVLNVYLILNKRIKARKKLGNLEERQALIDELTRLQLENHDHILKDNRKNKFIDELLNERDHNKRLIEQGGLNG